MPQLRDVNRRWLMPLVFAVLTIALFGDCLIVPGRVPASVYSDLRWQYINWRIFAVDQIRRGHFPLWNPYSLCGMPFFGDPQSAMLFPPNWLYLILSPELASSWLVAAHVFLAAYFTGRWVLRRGGSVMAAILGGTVYACCGPLEVNISVGHLPLLFSCAWAPLLLNCMEDIFDGGTRRLMGPVLTGIGVVALLATDGYPQFAYYTALFCGFYGLLLLPRSTRRMKAAAASAVVFAGGWALALAQIMATRSLTGESIRSGGLSYEKAAAFSLPPENLLGLILPAPFGDAARIEYYGRSTWVDSCPYVGAAVLALAVFGIGAGRKQKAIAVLAGLSLILALGVHVPIYAVLYRWLPGFGYFRATSRLCEITGLFIALLAAAGWDRLRTAQAHVALTAATAGVGLLALAGGVWASFTEHGGPGEITRLVHAFAASGQSNELKWSVHPTFAVHVAAYTAEELTTASLAMLLTAALLALCRSRTRLARAALVGLAAFQSIGFALRVSLRSDGFEPLQNGWAQALAQVAEPQRVVIGSVWLAEAGPRLGFLNVTGYNPLLLSRYGHYLAAVNSQPVDEASMMDLTSINDRLCRMLRGAMVLPSRRLTVPYHLLDPLGEFVLLSNYRVAATPEDALADVLDERFDPAQTVVLESTPDFASMHDPQAPGEVRLVRQTVDEMEIEADVKSPCVLLITAAYSKEWHAAAVQAGDTRTYQVVPADYCLRGIPLAAGRHHFVLRYRPAAVVAGLWISGVSAAFYLIAVISIAVKSMKRIRGAARAALSPSRGQS